uniref:C2H2-type domain-containing protein n=1 Tax=Chinchilla lanigera TaxID=34839 RepID=A0A8C2UIV3_CHILA
MCSKTLFCFCTLGRNSDDQHIQDECRNCRKNLRGEEAEKSPQCKLQYQHRVTVSQTSGTSVRMKAFGIKPGDSLSCRRLRVGPSAADGLIIANTALKPHEQQGFQEKLSMREKHGKACTELQSFEKYAKTSPVEKAREYMPCVKSYSDCTEVTTLEKKPDVMSFMTPHSVQIGKRCHSVMNMDICVPWDKSFNSLQIQTHQKAHSGEKTHIHKNYGKSFTTNSLGNHERTHRGEKPYICKQCGKAFSNHSNRQVHERTHTGEKPYVCKQCGKAFSTSVVCQNHERTHTGEKPYACNQCGKAFNRKDNWRIHERTHTGEKPYASKQCGKVFSTSGPCQNRKCTPTREKPYVCTQRGKAFSR